MLSVVIPVFNRPRSVLLAIDSVINQRRLDNTPLEIIVVDDGSTQPVSHAELAERHSQGTLIKAINLAQNLGAGAARNAGIFAAAGEFIAFLDSDDVWLPGKIAWQIEHLRQLAEARPGVPHAVSCGFYYQSSSAGVLQCRIPKSASTLREFASGCWYSPGSTVLMPRETCSRVGLFDERLRALEDLDWFIRFGQIGGQLHVLPQPGAIVFRRREPRNFRLVQDSCKVIGNKFGPGSVSALEPEAWRRLKAHLDMEVTIAGFRNRKLLSTFRAATRLLTSVSRVRLGLSDHWTEVGEVPSSVIDTYEVLTRAVSQPLVRENKRILFVAYSLGLGGTEKHLSLVLPALQARGYTVRLYNISGMYHATITDRLVRAGVEIISPYNGPPVDQTTGQTPISQLLRGIVGLWRAYRSDPPDLVHLFLPRAYIIGTVIAYLSWGNRGTAAAYHEPAQLEFLSGEASFFRQNRAGLASKSSSNRGQFEPGRR